MIAHNPGGIIFGIGQRRSLVQRVPRVILELKDPRVLQARKVIRELEVLPVPRVNGALQGHKGRKVSKALQAHRGSQLI
jgi:hypothetical protein